MSVSICLSVCLWHLCIVVTGCDGSRIPLHAWIDRCLCYLLTTPHPDCRMGRCRDFWWKRGSMEKLVIVAISIILLLFYRWTGNTWRLCFYERCWRFAFFYFSNLGRKCIISEERFVLGLPTSRAMLATARLLLIYLSKQTNKIYLSSYSATLPGQSTKYKHKCQCQS